MKNSPVIAPPITPIKYKGRNVSEANTVIICCLELFITIYGTLFQQTQNYDR